MATAENRLPRLVDGIDVRALPIGPADAFVLSRVDGNSSEADIAAATGLEVQAVSQTIARLLALGAIEVLSKVEPAPRPYRPRMHSWTQLGANTVQERVQHLSHHPGAQLYDPQELEETADLDASRKRVILDIFYRLERIDHYELLGVPRTADKKAIRARYHEVINVYHPDRYYGKQLGSFKAKLERIFQRVTEAHDVLSRNEARAEYDSYLNAGLSTRELEQRLQDEEAVARELQAVRARIEAEAEQKLATAPPAAAGGSPGSGPPLSIPPMAASSVPPRTSMVPSLPPSDPVRSSLTKNDADARRRALARKLGLSAPPPPLVEARPSPAAPPQENWASHERAAQDLKRRYEQRMVEAGRRQVDEYVARAEEASSKKQLVEAVNALRIAVSLAPNDASLRQRLEAMQTDATRELAGRYLEQAQYEEREHHWPEAARSYARALQGAPSPALHERLAFCLLAAHGDMKQAVEHARKAVLGTPNDPKCRQTLARAYAAANMKESAIGELERASALSPTDDSIKEQIRRARRGEF